MNLCLSTESHCFSGFGDPRLWVYSSADRADLQAGFIYSYRTELQIAGWREDFGIYRSTRLESIPIHFSRVYEGNKLKSVHWWRDFFKHRAEGPNDITHRGRLLTSTVYGPQLCWKTPAACDTNMSCAMENVVFFPRPKEAHIMSDYKVRLEMVPVVPWVPSHQSDKCLLQNLPVDCWA